MLMDCPEGATPLTRGDWILTVIEDPFVKNAGPFYRIDTDDPVEPMRFGFVIETCHCNRLGSCHGGMLATFLDISLGFVGKAACGDELLTPTISLSMDFLRPASIGEWVESRIRLVHQTRRMFFVEGTLVTVEGPIVRASAIYKRQAKGTPEAY